MTVQVVIPYLSNPWMIEDCVESFRETSVPVLIIDNSPGRDLEHMKFPSNVELVCFGLNRGVAASWNMGLKKGADQTLIVSQSVRFAPSEHPRRNVPCGLDHVVAGIQARASEYGLTFGDQGYHVISIGRKTVETIGLFDENFLAYGEDDEYNHRMNLVGIKLPDWGDWKESGIFSVAFCVQKRAGDIFSGSKGRIRDYYNFKWSSSPDKYPGDYQHPFNNPLKGLDYWPEVQYA